MKSRRLEHQDPGDGARPGSAGEPKGRRLLAAAGLALLLAGCADSRDAVMKQALESLEDQVALLRTVTDAGSAAKAVERARWLATRQAEVQARMEKLPPPGPDEQRKLRETYAPRMAEASQALLQEAMRVAFVPGGSEVLKALQVGR